MLMSSGADLTKAVGFREAVVNPSAWSLPRVSVLLLSLVVLAACQHDQRGARLLVLPGGVVHRLHRAARQVRGDAGDHQVEGAKLALGHAYGGGAQFFSMWVVGAEKP